MHISSKTQLHDFIRHGLRFRDIDALSTTALETGQARSSQMQSPFNQSRYLPILNKPRLLHRTRVHSVVVHEDVPSYSVAPQCSGKFAPSIQLILKVHLVGNIYVYLDHKIVQTMSKILKF